MIKTYKITFKLSSPISLNSPFIHFDGLLQFAKAIEEKGDETFIYNNQNYEYKKLDLPIKYKRFYYCSVGIFDTSKRLVNKIYKKPYDLYHKWCNKKKAYLKAGNFRTYLINQSYCPISEVAFYFETNNIKEVERLIKLIPGIGKYVNEGFGWIEDYKIEEKEGSSIIRKNKTLRTLPHDFVLCEGNLLSIPYEPPYFLKGKFKCFLPFSQVIS